MDTNQVAEEKVGETITPQVSSPQTEAPPTEANQTTSEVASQEGTKAEFPEGSEEQRKAFQEMRQELKQLKEEKKAREKQSSAFDAFRPQSVVPQDVEAFRDQYTGEVNWGAYNAAQEQRIRGEAAQAARDELDEFQARQTYPELFADTDTEQLIADRWIAAKVRGEAVSISSIAERVAKQLGKAVSKAEKSARAEAFNEVSEKEQAGLSAQGQASTSVRQAQSQANHEELAFQTRTGNDDALAARMRNIPWANK